MRHGQWIEFKVSSADPDAYARLVRAGAHVTPTGHFLGIFLRAGAAAVTEVVRPDGKKERSGGEPIPARLMIVDGEGCNLPVMVRGPGGTAELRNAQIMPHECEELRACTEADHLPARRRQHLKPGTKLPA